MVQASLDSSGPTEEISTIATASVGRAVLPGRGFTSLFIGAVRGGDWAVVILSGCLTIWSRGFRQGRELGDTRPRKGAGYWTNLCERKYGYRWTSFNPA